MNIYRQGDVLPKQIEKLPTNSKKKSNKTVAYGEVTGHSHRFENDGVTVYELENKLYLQVFTPSPLLHQEHNTLIIDPGIYEINNEREYDYFEEEMKKVID